jgi:hypothetical protein
MTGGNARTVEVVSPVAAADRRTPGAYGFGVRV